MFRESLGRAKGMPGVIFAAFFNADENHHIKMFGIPNKFSIGVKSMNTVIKTICPRLTKFFG